MVAELASMEDIRALSRNKLEVSRFDIDALLEKHGFSSSRTIQRLDGNFTNLTLDVETQAHGRVFLKMQFRRTRGFSLEAEFIATRALPSYIEATLPELWDRLLAAMDPLPAVWVRGGNVFLWGEPGLHNVLVENGGSLRITNVHDFQSAGWGTPSQ